MNHPRAIQIAAAVGKPERAPSIERQIERNARLSEFDTSLSMAAGLDAARRLAAHGKALGEAEQRLVDVKASTRALNDEQRVRLAIFVLDGVDGISTDLRVEAESVLADILSGVRT